VKHEITTATKGKTYLANGFKSLACKYLINSSIHQPRWNQGGGHLYPMYFKTPFSSCFIKIATSMSYCNCHRLNYLFGIWSISKYISRSEFPTSMDINATCLITHCQQYHFPGQRLCIYQSSLYANWQYYYSAFTEVCQVSLCLMNDDTKNTYFWLQ